MLKIAICDDDLPITTEIESLLLDIGRNDCIRMDIDIFFDGRALYREIHSGTNFDIVYMDIEMNNLDGIQAAHLIRSHNLPTILIYISAYDTYFKQLFEVEPFRFISKPIDTHLFHKYFIEAYKKINSQLQFFTFSFNQKYTKVPISEIIYFESCGRDVLIHTNTLEYRFLSKLDNIEQYLSKNKIDFLRIHQSYLINPYHIKSITLSTIEMNDHSILRIGPKYQSRIRLQYLQIIEDL